MLASRFRPFVAAALANCTGTSTPANFASGSPRDEATSRLTYAAEAFATVDNFDLHRIPSQIAERTSA
jgi:hypothetical protein